ncbi:hypothetical protein ACFYNO_33635 [Kitasatospora sp. NPDC006697]|uniref:hypothetical protein n=1 Tax=Kitasatospora sp. NPDC006697 TaxID=3364020 RepID=UPI0036920B72
MDLTPEQRNDAAMRGHAALTSLLQQDVSGFFPPAEQRRPALIAWGLVAALQRQACAVVLLHRKGLGHEAAPNRRLMIEYMAQLQWLAKDGDGAVDSMNKAFQYTHSKLRKSVDEGGVFTYDDEVAASADAVAAAEIPPNAANQYSLTAKLLARLGHGLLEIWTSETQLSHAGLTAARAFFEDSSQEAVILHDTPHFGSTPDPSVLSPYMAFMLFYFGVEAFNDLMVGSPWSADLERIASECGLGDAGQQPQSQPGADGSQ